MLSAEASDTTTIPNVASIVAPQKDIHDDNFYKTGSETRLLSDRLCYS